MSNDSRYVLSQLTRSGIWSSWRNLLDYKHMVLEADSIIAYLYQCCLNKHIKRQRGLLTARSSTTIDYYSATLVNFQELASLIELLLDYFAQCAIELDIVYRGNHMEAPLFGLGPAQFKKNTQRVSESLIALLDYEASLVTPAANGSRPKGKRTLTLNQMRPTRPNLALNLFKQIVNSRAAATAVSSTKRPSIKCHQAFYCPYPTCARLARDLKCPVMTNDGDFIVMDVRAGFILFEEFFVSQLANNSSVLRHPGSVSSSSVTSVTSMARNQLVVGGQASRAATTRSPSIADLASSKSLFQQRRPSSTASNNSSTKQAGPPRTKSLPPPSKRILNRFHFHRSFLLQHPGLNPALALQLFPLTSGEFLVQHAKSLLRLRIYDREFQEKDIIVATIDQASFRKYHMAAARLELVMRFLCAKDADVVPNLIRGEAKRLASPIEHDYQELYNYYAIAYHFKGRLRMVLSQKITLNLQQANHIESCLLARECTADFWLSLLSCSLGRLASVDYNKSMQFEDLQTIHSARSMLDRPKCLMMCILGGDNKLHKSEHSPTISKHQRKQLDMARLSTASLTVIDRQSRKLTERIISPASYQQQLNHMQVAQFEQLRSRLTLFHLVKPDKNAIGAPQASQVSGVPTTVKSDSVALINLAFNSHDIVSLSSLDQHKGQKIAISLTQAAAGGLRQNHQQLAILVALHRYSLDQAMRDDQYFKQNYLSLSRHFETGLINHHLYGLYTELHLKRADKSSTGGGGASGLGSVPAELRQLVDLIQRHDLENVANLKGLAAEFAATKDASAKTKKTANSVISFKETTAKHRQSSIGRIKDSKLTSKIPSEIIMVDQKTKHIRHLIELLNSSIEAYCELNAFLSYPQQQLQLQFYNPILLFNLTLFSYLSGATPTTHAPKPVSKITTTSAVRKKKV